MVTEAKTRYRYKRATKGDIREANEIKKARTSKAAVFQSLCIYHSWSAYASRKISARLNPEIQQFICAPAAFITASMLLVLAFLISLASLISPFVALFVTISCLGFRNHPVFRLFGRIIDCRPKDHFGFILNFRQKVLYRVGCNQ